MRLDNKAASKSIKIGKHELEEVQKIKYLRITIAKTGDRNLEIPEKIVTTNKALHAN